ncbi:NUDIX domain-containing protein [Asticcacaulis sp. AC402]|uniref:NUDIX domain-containing protein n=1 Tax=Asticcacaulis sp. AC402 TaxID=1282361 RepID=UPI0003C3E9B9|nr:NUDIX hydrolase [Asticcacaulis sp. AC402]ESQ76980.1 hypothetical protein ABAC402_02595 [Asticcacaulis sp. AC402]
MPDLLMAEIKQFGARQAGLVYKPRVGAYGILLHEGRIACAQIGYTKFAYDLPGGALDPGETPEQAVVREFLEETGLEVAVGRQVTQIDHYFVHDDGTPYNNRCHFYEVEMRAHRPAAKTELDHELVWLPPLEVIKRLKNEGYAWAMVLWLRAMR